MLCTGTTGKPQFDGSVAHSSTTDCNNTTAITTIEWYVVGSSRYWHCTHTALVHLHHSLVGNCTYNDLSEHERSSLEIPLPTATTTNNSREQESSNVSDMVEWVFVCALSELSHQQQLMGQGCLCLSTVSPGLRSIGQYNCGICTNWKLDEKLISTFVCKSTI